MNKQTFVKSPLRLSLFGGGTDIPYIYKKLGKGITITAAIDFYVTVGCSNLPLFNGIKLKYSNNETSKSIDSLIHPIFKEALNFFNYDPEDLGGIEIISTASIPSGNGLGSSAAFTTSLCKCLAMQLNNEDLSKKDLLEISTKIEHSSGNNQIGYQDQIASIYGSLTKATYSKDNIKIEYPSKAWEMGMIKMIESNGFLYKTNSRKGISSNFIGTESLSKKINLYEKVLSIAEKVNIQDASFNEDQIVSYLIETSILAKETKVRTKEIQEIEEKMKSIGAIYSKQLGAGGGGFVFCLFDKKDPYIPEDMLDKMLRPKIVKDGTKIL